MIQLLVLDSRYHTRHSFDIILTFSFFQAWKRKYLTKSVFCQIAHQLISTTPSFLEIGLCGSVEGLLLASKLIYIGMYLLTMHFIHACGSLECDYFIKHVITFQVERGPAVPWVPSWTGQRFLGLQVERGNNIIIHTFILVLLITEIELV